MTDKSTPKKPADSDGLIEQLHRLKNATPFLAKDEAAKFAALVVASIRRLENRITELEDDDNGSQSNA